MQVTWCCPIQRACKAYPARARAWEVRSRRGSQAVAVGGVSDGAASRRVAALDAPGHPLHALYLKVKERGLLLGVCKACAGKMGTLAAARSQGLRLLEDMSGHPSMAGFQRQGHRVITF